MNKKILAGLIALTFIVMISRLRAGVENPGGGGSSGGSGTVTNATSTGAPWLTFSGTGTATLNIATNSTKIPTGNIASGFANLSSFNTFATSNQFTDRLGGNTNVWDNDTTETFQTAPKAGQTGNYWKLIYAGLGSSALIRLSDVDVAGPFANFTITTSGQLRITSGGSGAIGGNIGSASFDHMVWDQTGHVTFGDGSAQTFNFISGSVVKVGSQFTGNRNTTNMLGSGISNVTVYSQGFFVTNFTIP
jgi:hypothetical protein